MQTTHRVLGRLAERGEQRIDEGLDGGEGARGHLRVQWHVEPAGRAQGHLEGAEARVAPAGGGDGGGVRSQALGRAWVGEGGESAVEEEADGLGDGDEGGDVPAA